MSSGAEGLVFAYLPQSSESTGWGAGAPREGRNRGLGGGYGGSPSSRTRLTAPGR